jgi:hypothetical protein
MTRAPRCPRWSRGAPCAASASCPSAGYTPHGPPAPPAPPWLRCARTGNVFLSARSGSVAGSTTLRSARLGNSLRQPTREVLQRRRLYHGPAAPVPEQATPLVNQSMQGVPLAQPLLHSPAEAARCQTGQGMLLAQSWLHPSSKAHACSAQLWHCGILFPARQCLNCDKYPLMSPVPACNKLHSQCATRKAST